MKEDNNEDKSPNNNKDDDTAKGQQNNSVNETESKENIETKTVENKSSDRDENGKWPDNPSQVPAGGNNSPSLGNEHRPGAFHGRGVPAGMRRTDIERFRRAGHRVEQGVGQRDESNVENNVRDEYVVNTSIPPEMRPVPQQQGEQSVQSQNIESTNSENTQEAKKGNIISRLFSKLKGNKTKTSGQDENQIQEAKLRPNYERKLSKFFGDIGLKKPRQKDEAGILMNAEVKNKEASVEEAVEVVVQESAVSAEASLPIATRVSDSDNVSIGAVHDAQGDPERIESRQDGNQISEPSGNRDINPDIRHTTIDIVDNYDAVMVRGTPEDPSISSSSSNSSSRSGSSAESNASIPSVVDVPSPSNKVGKAQNDLENLEEKVLSQTGSDDFKDRISKVADSLYEKGKISDKQYEQLKAYLDSPDLGNKIAKGLSKAKNELVRRPQDDTRQR